VSSGRQWKTKEHERGACLRFGIESPIFWAAEISIDWWQISDRSSIFAAVENSFGDFYSAQLCSVSLCYSGPDKRFSFQSKVLSMQSSDNSLHRGILIEPRPWTVSITISAIGILSWSLASFLRTQCRSSEFKVPISPNPIIGQFQLHCSTTSNHSRKEESPMRIMQPRIISRNSREQSCEKVSWTFK
jgi:hypothetical protein